MEENLRLCSGASWPQRLREAGHVEMAVLEMPEQVAAHVLGEHAATLAISASDWPSSFSTSQQDRSDYDDADAYSEGEGETEYERLPEWFTAVDATIANLGGAVLPKTNWSAPKDATWMTVDGSLRCTSAKEVMILLRSSDYVAADVDQARALGLRPALVLKAWRPMAPASEFRCFVMHGRLVAIAQRHTHEVFASIAAVGLQCINEAVTRFVSALPLPCSDCVVDVYVGDQDSVSLVDVAPLDISFLESAPSLFTWDELVSSSSSTTTMIRIVDASSLRGVQPGPRNLCGVPIELRDATSVADMAEIINAMERDYSHSDIAPQPAPPPSAGTAAADPSHL